MRLALRSTAVHYRMQLVAPLAMLTWFVVPVLHATFAVYLFESGAAETALLYAAIGAGFVGMWTWVVWHAGMALYRERGEGTLELLVCAPAPLVLVLLGRTLAIVGVGAYDLTIESPVAFGIAVIVSVAALGCLGLIFACLFVLTRDAQSLAGVLDTPPWLLCGFFVSIAVLPEWTRPLSWALAPTFGLEALRGAAAGREVVWDLAACAGLAIAYIALSTLLLRHVERRARVRATLGLA